MIAEMLKIVLPVLRSERASAPALRSLWQSSRAHAQAPPTCQAIDQRLDAARGAVAAALVAIGGSAVIGAACYGVIPLSGGLSAPASHACIAAVAYVIVDSVSTLMNIGWQLGIASILDAVSTSACASDGECADPGSRGCCEFRGGRFDNGRCEVPCKPPASQTCDGRCVDLDSDPRHCGRCGHACVAKEECDLGTCRSTVGTLCCNPVARTSCGAGEQCNAPTVGGNPDGSPRVNWSCDEDVGTVGFWGMCGYQPPFPLCGPGLICGTAGAEARCFPLCFNSTQCPVGWTCEIERGPTCFDIGLCRQNEP